MIELADLLRIPVAAGFLVAAGAKLILSSTRLARYGMTVVAELSRAARIGIALVEIAGAAALLAPWLVGAPVWTARAAALVLTVLMTGASWLQVTRRRALGAAISLVMLTLTASLAVTPTVPVGMS